MREEIPTFVGMKIMGTKDGMDVPRCSWGRKMGYFAMEIHPSKIT